MYVVEAKVFLQMAEAEAHQVLKRKGLVHMHRPSQSSAVAAFVSHQWCGRSHPDPLFKQLRVLQHTLRNASAGALSVDVDVYSSAMYFHRSTVSARSLRSATSWLLWYDYFSIPQPAATGTEPDELPELCALLGLAVQSLPHYVASCALFLVLAPSVRHEDGHVVDYASWKSRGWCRLERVARSLSQGPSSILQVARADTIIEIGGREFLVEPVGMGEFSDERDKLALAPVVEQMLAEKLQSLHSLENLSDYRQLLSWCPKLLEGFEGGGSLPRQLERLDPRRPSAHRSSGDIVEQFLELLQLQGDVARLCTRPLPLLVASGLGDVRVMAALLQRRAHVACRNRRSDVTFFWTKGQQPIHVAAQRGHIAAVDMLLQHFASLEATDALAQTPLFYAATCGGCAVMELLLDRRADIAHRGIVAEAAALENAVIFGRAAEVATLLKRGVPIAKSRDGINALHMAAVFRPGAEVVRLLIEARVCMEDRCKPRFGGAFMILLMFLSIPGYFGRRSWSVNAARHVSGCTPLGLAVLNVSLTELEVLLDAGADVHARQARGLNIQGIADLFGCPLDMLV